VAGRGGLSRGDDSVIQVVTVENDPEGEDISDSHASRELSLMEDDYEQGRAQRWVEDDVEAAIRSEGRQAACEDASPFRRAGGMEGGSCS